MPVYGPIDFNGKPIGIDIFIVEIDAEDNQTQALLKTLATAGAKAYPPAQPVLAVLNQLGDALLKGRTDDIEFRYSMVLDPARGYRGMAYAVAEAGNYVFVREQTRDKTTEWESLVLNENDGRLYHRGSNALYRDTSYLSVQINRNAGNEEVQLAQNTYGAFRKALEDDQTERAERLSAVLLPTLNQLALDRVQIRNFSKARSLLEQVRAAGRTTQEHLLAANTLYELMKRSIAQLNPASIVVTDITSCAGLVQRQTQSVESDLSGEQLDFLNAALARRAVASDANAFNQLSCNAVSVFANGKSFDDFKAALKL